MTRNRSSCYPYRHVTEVGQNCNQNVSILVHMMDGRRIHGMSYNKRSALNKTNVRPNTRNSESEG